MKKDKRSVGYHYEEKAVKWLENQGYVVVYTNYYGGHCEVDVICTQEKCLVFVEVKYREEKKGFNVYQSIDRKKMENIKKVMEGFFQKERQFKDYFGRIDGLFFIKNKEGERVEHIKHIDL